MWCCCVAVLGAKCFKDVSIGPLGDRPVLGERVVLVERDDDSVDGARLRPLRTDLDLDRRAAA